MIVTYNIGSLAARIKLTGINYLHGGVIQHDLIWTILHLNEDGSEVKKTYEGGEQAVQPTFDVPAGLYRIQAHYQGDILDLGKVNLERNSLTDALFILKLSGEIGTEEEFHADPNLDTEYERRKIERSDQAAFGTAEMPVRDPNPSQQGEYGSAIQAHPLLADKAQFDGVPADMRSEPSENDKALEMTLECQQQNQAQPGSTPTPRAGG